MTVLLDFFLFSFFSFFIKIKNKKIKSNDYIFDIFAISCLRLKVKNLGLGDLCVVLLLARLNDLFGVFLLATC
jgi:hypothetical protein